MVSIEYTDEYTERRRGAHARRTNAPPRERHGLHADVFLQPARPRLAAVEVAVAVDDGELGAVAGAHARVAPGIEHELVHGARRGVADANAHVPARVLDVVGFRVGDDDAALGVEEDAARPAELRPAREVRAFLVEELNAVVRAVADEHAAAGVDRDRVQ